MSATAKRLQALFRHLAEEITALDKSISVGQFILHKLINAPWNTTSTFFTSQTGWATCCWRGRPAFVIVGGCDFLARGCKE